MSRASRIVLAILVLFVLAFAGVAFALNAWISTADFRTRVNAQLSKAAGVPVELGGLSITMFPLPGVAVDQVRVQSRPAITLERIEARPAWASLLHGSVQLKTLVVRNAVLPQEAIASVIAAYDKAHPKDASKPSAPPTQDQLAIVPRNMEFESITWVQATKERIVIDAQAGMDDDNLPGDVHVRVRQGKFAGTDAKLEREGDRWNVKVRVAGGSITGTLKANRIDKQSPVIVGELQTSNVEVSELTAPSRTLTGKLDARTTLQAPLQNLPDGARTQTQFTVRNALVHGIDLARAVKTVGLSRGGETHLDTLAGTLATQGKALQLNNLVASSGSLSADGSVAMAADKRLSGHVTVSLLGQSTSGALGVPLAVGGTMDQPSVTLSRGALLGAAIGTAIAPGLGTAPGANLGDRVGAGIKSLFGSK